MSYAIENITGEEPFLLVKFWGTEQHARWDTGKKMWMDALPEVAAVIHGDELREEFDRVMMSKTYEVSFIGTITDDHAGWGMCLYPRDMQPGAKPVSIEDVFPRAWLGKRVKITAEILEDG